MRRPVLALLALLALVSVACGGIGGRTRDRRLVVGAINRVGDAPYRFEYEERLPDPKKTIRVEGLVQDDLRSRATLEIDNTDVLEYIVSDDALAVRAIDQAAAAPYIAAVGKQEQVAGQGLKDGKWVVDHQGAPELIAPRNADNVIEVGINPILDASTYIFQYLTEALNAADREGVNQFNPDGVEYNPLDDPWKEDVDADLVDKGIRRFDIVQPQLPRPTQRGTAVALPSSQHFRKMAFYMDGTSLQTVKEEINIRSRPEFRRALAGRQAEYYLKLLAQSLAGATRDPVRQREMEITFERADDVEIGLPADNFVSVPTVDLITEVATLMPPPPATLGQGLAGGGGARPTPPASGAPTTTGAPATTGAPTGTPAASGGPPATAAPEATISFGEAGAP